jgi:hypothetical protein
MAIELTSPEIIGGAFGGAGLLGVALGVLKRIGSVKIGGITLSWGSNGNGGEVRVCQHHEAIASSLSVGEKRFEKLEQKIDDMPGKVVTLLRDTKGLLS